MNIREYYVSTYPTDELGMDINPSATFDGLFSTLDRGGDVYGYFGVGDSIIRERLFERLAQIAEVPYDYIYQQWVNA